MYLGSLIKKLMIYCLGKGSIKKKSVEFSTLLDQTPPLLHSKCGKSKKKLWSKNSFYTILSKRKISIHIQNENFHEILTVSKHSHFEVDFILVIS